jgi:hypothetical protein
MYLLKMVRFHLQVTRRGIDKKKKGYQDWRQSDRWYVCWKGVFSDEKSPFQPIAAIQEHW